MPKYIPMKDKPLIRFDWALKYLLRNKANFDVLEGFLSELLHQDVKIDSVLESESNKISREDKSNRVDILACLQAGEKVIIEVQCVQQWDFLSRLLYGVSKVAVEHLKQGEPYGKIPRIIAVTIVYFDLGRGEDYIYRGQTNFKGIHRNDELLLGEEEKRHYPTHVQGIPDIYPEYYVIKVPQFDSRIQDKLDEWVYLFKNAAVKPDFNAKGIEKAGQVLDVLKMSDKDRAHYQRFLESIRNDASIFETYFDDGFVEGQKKGEAIGIQKGEAIGIEKGEAKLVYRMHKSGLSPQEIARLTNLPLARVHEIIEGPSHSS